MEAPECMVCGDAVAADDQHRVRFSDRIAVDGSATVGRPDGAGWFCDRHVDAARERSDVPIAAAVAELQAGERSLPPTSPKLEAPVLRRIPCATIGVSRLANVMSDNIDAIVEPLGMAAPTLSEHSRRDWTPMDGVQAPWCPYSDHRWFEGVDDRSRVRISSDRTHWSDDELANAGVALAVWRRPHEQLVLSVQARDHQCEGIRAQVNQLTISEPVSAAQASAVAALVAAIDRAMA